MPELILIRHGVTIWNRQGRFQGRSNVPLSEHGRVQAQALADALHHESLEAIYASDLGRAVETAEIIAKRHDLEVLLEPRLREFDFGRWEGLTWDEIVTAYPPLREQGATSARLYRPEGGESFEEVRERVASFLDDIQTRHPHGTVAAVAHAGPLHAALAALLARSALPQRESLQVVFSPAGITRIAMDEAGVRLISLDDLRHLDSPGRS